MSDQSTRKTEIAVVDSQPLEMIMPAPPAGFTIQIARRQSWVSPRQKRLSVCVALLLGFSAQGAFADTVFVTNCSNTGTGSLRSAVAAANSGDTVDMSGLTSSNTGCAASTITLTTGAVAVAQSSLKIVGPGMTDLAVSGDYKGRVFNHTGTGTLTLQNFSFRDGYVKESGFVYGGCLYSKGSVDLFEIGVSACTVYSTGKTSTGGAIYARKNVTLKYSTVSNSEATGLFAIGGGVASGLGLSAKFSEISDNSVKTSPIKMRGEGGGVAVYGNVYILNSLIANNSADLLAGGLLARAPAGETIVIANSTISNNSSLGLVGGASLGGAVSAYNSTIAFNTAGYTNTAIINKTTPYSAGLHTYTATVHLESTLIANNTYGASNKSDDFSITPSAAVSGSHNLVFNSSAPLPEDTIVGKCPILGRLRSNGGSTRTIALQSNSPGVDQGSNIFNNGSSIGLNEDQRGQVLDPTPYPFPRVSGSAADIGAYEINQADIVFTANFEGCP